MDWYWQVYNHMKIWSHRGNKVGILPSCSWVSTIVWLHHWSSNETLGVKASWELHKDATYCFKQILKAAPHKSATVPLYLTNHLINMSKTCWKNKDELMSDVLQWTPTHRHTIVGWPAKNLLSSTLCRHLMPSRGPANWGEWKERVKPICAISLLSWS